MRRILLIAYHYPPCAGSSGLLRSLKFSRYLPEFGWQPVVLSIRAVAYSSIDPRGDKAVPGSMPVIRAFGFDIKKIFSRIGFYPDWLAIPDRWSSWIFGAIPAGLSAIRRHRVELIFSTFPISSAVLVGLLLRLLTGKPWVADFRDSMTEDSYPREKWRRIVWRWIEKQAVRRASRLIFTAASTRKMYLDRYRFLSPAKCLLIPNGYDEEDFTHILSVEAGTTTEDRPLRLLHTGLIYPEERDPRPFFRALQRLKREGKISSAMANIVFRAAGSEGLYQQIINELQIGDLIQLQPHVPYRQALQECADAEGLLLFQAANCDHQIPAKTYEYLRLRKPIFALTTHTGDTAALLREVGGATIVDLADENAIYAALPDFLNALRAGTHPRADSQKITSYTRRKQAEQLAHCLSELRREARSVTPEKAKALRAKPDERGTEMN